MEGLFEVLTAFTSATPGDDGLRATADTGGGEGGSFEWKKASEDCCARKAESEKRAGENRPETAGGQGIALVR